MRSLKIEQLTPEAFAPFGDVVACQGHHPVMINEGTTQRFHDLAHVEFAGDGTTTLISIFIGQPRAMPVAVKMMERHPLGSQCFMPLQQQDYLVVVAEGESAPAPETLRAFAAGGAQGVNYHRGVWHHPLLVLEADSSFLVVDRGGPGDNLEEHFFSGGPVAMLGV